MKKIINVYTLIAVVYLLAVFGYLTLFYINKGFSLRLIGDSKVYVNVNEKYFENGYLLTLFGKKVDGVQVYDNINTKKVGEYKVYYYKKFFMFNTYKSRTVYVVDKVKPELKLKGKNVIYIYQNKKYKEPGYSSVDNVDGDVTKDVIVKSNVNNKKPGKYSIKYISIDSSGNESTMERKVEVLKPKPKPKPVIVTTVSSSSISNNYSLQGKFTNVILEYESTQYNHTKDAVFIGDSNTLFLNQKGGYLPKKQVWGRFNMNIAQINHSTFTTLADGRTVNLNTALNKYHPKYLIANLGINSALYMDINNVVRELDAFFNHMKKDYPNTKVLISSVNPTREFGTVSGSYYMNRINQINYYAARECSNYGISFINFTDQIKNSKGYGDNKYLYCAASNDCGFHLSGEGKKKYINYLNHLNFERN